MKKPSLLLVLLLPFVAGCGTIVKTTAYDVGLKSVETPSMEAGQSCEANVDVVRDEDYTGYAFSDEYIGILWDVSDCHFNFKLTNLSDYTIKIPWDEVVYIDADMVANRIMHSGIKYSDRNASQPASVIPKGTTISDIIMPTDNVYWNEWSYADDSYFRGAWEEIPLFPQYGSRDDAEFSDFPGKTVSIVMPIIVQDTAREYVFTFEINDLEYREERRFSPLWSTVAVSAGLTAVLSAVASVLTISIGF